MDQEQKQTMELLELEQQVTNLDIKVGGVDRKVDSILYLLAGSEFDKNNGLVVKVNQLDFRIKELEESMYNNAIVSKVQAHEERISKLEKLLTRAQWTLVGMGIPASIGIFEMLRKIVTKN